MQFQSIQSGASHTRTFRRGTSLIEILVVLVILVIGILSIVRLFPAGFIALRNAENNTFAARLAQGALEQLKKSGNGLPDAIYMYSTDEKGFNPNFAPDNFGSYPTTGTVDAAYNDINKQRYISNETITVPAPHVVNGASYPPLYVVNYGPISLPDPSLLTVNSNPWAAQVGDSRQNPSDPSRSIDNPTDILQPGQAKYLVDLNGGRLAVPPAAYLKYNSATAYVPQDFVAVVTTTNPNTKVTTSTTVPLSILNTYDGNWFDNTTATNATYSQANLPPGPWTSVTLYRPFRYMGMSNSPSFDADPYEYYIYNSNISGTNTNSGVIAFNRSAAGQNGSQPLKAQVSYMVQDWHILHEDQTVDAGTPTVRLTLNHLKKVGDVQFDQSVYAGLVPSMTAPADILILDLDTGALTPLNTSNVQDLDDNTGATGNSSYQVSYQNGRITFPSGTAAQHLRIFYAGDADWALAVQKAPSAYTIVNAPGGAISTPTNTDYAKLTAVGPTSPNNCVIDLASQRAYFPLCDAGKTVEFDGISYTDSGTPSATHQIAEGTAAISTDTTPVAGGQTVVYVNLSGSGLNASGILPAAPSSSGNTPATIQAVRGISAQATVIWRERNRWRTRTIDTLLTQTQ